MTRPGPHASYCEHVSSEAEAVEEDGVKLLPCPFCGGEEITLHGERESTMGTWASCRSCGLETPTETGVTTEQAIEYWNTRANYESLRAQLEIARKALESAGCPQPGHTNEYMTVAKCVKRYRCNCECGAALTSGEQK